jgi:hypothetical protein
MLDVSYPEKTFVGFACLSKGTRESTGFLQTCGKTFSDPENAGKGLNELFQIVDKTCSKGSIKIYKAGTTDGKKIVLTQGSNPASTSAESKKQKFEVTNLEDGDVLKMPKTDEKDSCLKTGKKDFLDKL